MFILKSATLHVTANFRHRQGSHSLLKKLLKTIKTNTVVLQQYKGLKPHIRVW
jgi:hypothetical protein